MPYDNETEKIRLQLVTNYAKALQTMSVDPLIDSLHPDLLFKWVGHYGVRSDLRYLGFLYKAFYEMKRDGIKLHADVVMLVNGRYTYPAVKLFPPVDSRIFYQADWEVRWHNYTQPTTYMDELILYCRIKENKIFRVYCDAAMKTPSNDLLDEIHKPAITIIEAKYE